MQTFRVFANVIQNTAFPSLKMKKAVYKQQFIRTKCEDETVLAGVFYCFFESTHKRTILS